jgi:iron complex outermembrane receptor protein
MLSQLIKRAKILSSIKKEHIGLIVPLAILLASPVDTLAQQKPGLRGIVTLSENNAPLTNAVVEIVELRQTINTGDDGSYEFTNLPEGKYTVIAHLEKFPDVAQTVTVVDGNVANLDFAMSLTLQEQITITASGVEQAIFESFSSVNSLGSLQLAQKGQPSLGETLDGQLGIAKRSFGPGSARPVIRGFDGDRVLVLNDGLRSGTLGAQSGDHGENTDVLSADRIEILKGPATFLYGGNALGGVVNVLSGNDDFSHNHTGLTGYATALGGSTNRQGSFNGGLQYGVGRYLFFGNGGGQRTGDYDTPVSKIPNSRARTAGGSGGAAFYGDKVYFRFKYGYQDASYGIPFAAMFEAEEEEEVNLPKLSKLTSSKIFPLTPSTHKLINNSGNREAGEEFISLAIRQHNARFSFGFRDLGSFISNAQFAVNYSDYKHKEIEDTDEGSFVATTFNNRETTYRGLFTQARQGKLSGNFGFSGYYRNYDVAGAEALTPPVDTSNFAFFALEEIKYENIQLQFGARVETTRFDPIGLPKRDFTGFSGAVGVRIPIKDSVAFVANYTSSYRSPALEELYNNGPHIGSLAFEIGDVNLKRERNNGIDTSLRYAGKKLRGEVNFFYYDLDNFVFLAPTGNIEDGLIEATFSQADSRFVGAEAGFDYALHPNFSFIGSLDAVDAEIKDTNSPLPRIPPLRGRIGFEARYKGFSLKPEVIMARSQNQVFSTETRTPGYTTVNLSASYVLTQKHTVQVFSINAFNLNDRLYFNHLSLIKNLTPEIGRGVRFSYSLRFF